MGKIWNKKISEYFWLNTSWEGTQGRPALFEIVSTRDFGYSEQNKVTPKTIRASTTGGKTLLVVGYIVKGRRTAGYN